ncbi:precorrin-8X methylmutase [Carboxydothermus hydrogenoformans]|uniref:Precorrin-8X methylmutase n=1 Tax=Carboxydothermus hydrogenoformans (strain ATCC BAA-161 / DSM 6008 / Z-2901) TaxID=246194 RepID=Q3AE13_CARHZ|nr:precorrin-8X methylmutase [Carboxydothermus hydrogenoformans]ABB14285.1 precorrin-8X methylmutase [Carboxydothermus hydrogenoformans Z-2901]
MNYEFLINPREIEQKSFAIIESLTGLGNTPEDQVIKRAIHASGDPEIRKDFRFHPAAIDRGLAALKNKNLIITDVEMVRAGITGYAGEVACAIREEAVKRKALENKVTRAYQAMMELKERMDGAVIAIGNAPTALLAVIELIKTGVEPALVVGVPVGFVGAKESKELLLNCDVPYITLLGTKGGSTIAAAIVNALIKLSRTGGK